MRRFQDVTTTNTANSFQAYNKETAREPKKMSDQPTMAYNGHDVCVGDVWEMDQGEQVLTFLVIKVVKLNDLNTFKVVSLTSNVPFDTISFNQNFRHYRLLSRLEKGLTFGSD